MAKWRTTKTVTYAALSPLITKAPRRFSRGSLGGAVGATARVVAEDSVTRYVHGMSIRGFEIIKESPAHFSYSFAPDRYWRVKREGESIVVEEFTKIQPWETEQQSSSSNPRRWLTPSEARWLRDKAMPHLGIRGTVRVTEDHEYGKVYPDIWVEGRTITVTRQWARQAPRERLRRLLHEMIHIAGYPHMPERGFYSRPNKDTYSAKVMRDMEAGVPFRSG